MANYNKIYKEKNKERIKNRRKQFYKENRERLLTIQKNYNEKHLVGIRKYQRVYYRYKCYGIGKDEFEQMLLSQNNRCGICEIIFDLSSKKNCPHVDHNHNTGKLRRLLCMKCNCGIGNFNEDTSLMKKAIEYLQLYK